jgi:hypothetical protein
MKLLTLVFHQHNISNTTTAQNSGTTVRNDDERGIATQQRVQDEKMSDSKTSASVSGVTRSLEEDSPASAQKRVVRPRPGRSVECEHEKVLCFAARTRRGRFYIPSKDNVFGGMVVENVLIDSGCSSLLLSFPLEHGFPLEWRTDEYNWVVSFSRGTRAVHSPVLKISMHLGLEFSCSPGGKEQPRLNFLRFHMGSQGINHILETPQLVALLDPGCVATLIATRNQLAGTAPERTYALLGQLYLHKVLYAQSGDLGIALSKNYNVQDVNILTIMSKYERKLEPLVSAFGGFEDLEDDDGDDDLAGDDEDYRCSWDKGSSDDEIDEPDDR